MAPRRQRTDWKLLARRYAKERDDARALLRECEVALTLVPARAKETLPYTDGFLQGLQTEYIAPLMKKLRGQ